LLKRTVRLIFSLINFIIGYYYPPKDVIGITWEFKESVEIATSLSETG